MKERNTKDNIETLSTEFNKIWMQMTGKIQMIPLYKINKILDGIKNEKQKTHEATSPKDEEQKSEKSSPKKEVVKRKKKVCHI